MRDKWVSKEKTQPTHTPDRFWIDEFGDETLNCYVRDVLKHNRDIKLAETRIQIAASNARIVGADLYPHFGVSLDAERRKQNIFGIPLPGLQSGQPLSTQNNRFGVLFNFAWEADLWGVIRSEHSQAIAEMEATQYDKEALKLSLGAQAVRTWFIMAEAAEQVALAEQILQTYRSTEGIVQDRFEFGLAEGNTGSYGSQLLLARADIASAKDAVAARKEIVARTARQLEVLAGKYPDGKEGAKARLPQLPTSQPCNLPCTVLSRRPDIVAAERRLAAIDQAYEQSTKVIFPTIMITGDAGTATEQFINILNGDFSVWSLVGDITRPIFQAGKIRAAQQQVLFTIESAKLDYEKVILNAFGEVETALSSEQYLRERVIASTEAAKLAREAYERAGEEYVEGTGDILTVLTAQQRMYSVESALISLRRQQLEARVSLHLALAGSFDCIETINADPLPVRVW